MAAPGSPPTGVPSIHQGQRAHLLQRCLQKPEQLPKVSHWFYSSVGCQWAHGCGFHNHVGAPGFGKACLPSSEQCSASDLCWQLSSHVCCCSLSSLLPPCWYLLVFLPLSLFPPSSSLACSLEGNRRSKMTILSAVPADLTILRPGWKTLQHPRRADRVTPDSACWNQVLEPSFNRYTHVYDISQFCPPPVPDCIGGIDFCSLLLFNVNAKMSLGSTWAGCPASEQTWALRAV